MWTNMRAHLSEFWLVIIADNFVLHDIYYNYIKETK
jgi:hypothetical protein